MIGLKVRVYRNLHKKCFSVKCMKTQKVVAHVDSITLKDVTYPVSQAGRDRVLAERRKNVHAYVQGIVESAELADIVKMKKVCYNPYKKAFFFYCSNGREVKSSKYTTLTSNGVFAL